MAGRDMSHVTWRRSFPICGVCWRTPRKLDTWENKRVQLPASAFDYSALAMIGTRLLPAQSPCEERVIAHLFPGLSWPHGPRYMKGKHSMSRPKRIAFISEHASPLACLGSADAGGQNIYVDELSRHLGERGYQIDIFT